ncbi:MAG: hypothetical protein ACREFN_03390, partial [Acetobacteraceae bacterium]
IKALAPGTPSDADRAHSPVTPRRAGPARARSLAFCQAGHTVPAALPPAGTPVFGPEGPLGSVSGRSGGAAVINPTGGGATGTLVPNGDGTATIFQPDRPPIVILNPAR